MDKDIELSGGNPVLRRATELDPQFAFALPVLSAFYENVGDRARAKEAAEKAYSLRDQVSERERLFIEQQYYQMLGDFKKNREIGGLLTRHFPRDPVFHINQASLELWAGEPEKALAEAEEAIRNGPKIMSAIRLRPVRFYI